MLCAVKITFNGKLYIAEIMMHDDSVLFSCFSLCTWVRGWQGQESKCRKQCTASVKVRDEHKPQQAYR